MTYAKLSSLEKHGIFTPDHYAAQRALKTWYTTYRVRIDAWYERGRVIRDHLGYRCATGRLTANLSV
jgi:hypothetical protein